MPKNLRPAVDLMAFKCRTLKVNRTKSRVVTGLLTGHNNLRRQLYVMGLSDKPICWNCGTEEKTLVHVYVRVRPWLYSDTHIEAPSF
jgi:hypothetical protein